MFQQKGKNLTAIVQTAGPQQSHNVPTTSTQIGTTISFNFVPNDKIQFKPFITIQKTETEDLASLYLDPSVTYSNSTHKYTPGSFGGFYFNYRLTNKLNINLSSYYFGKQTQYDGSYDSNDTSTPQYSYGQVQSKFMLNAKVSYEVVKNLNLFVSGRNILNSDSREFYAADRTAGLYTGGLFYNLTK